MIQCGSNLGRPGYVSYTLPQSHSGSPKKIQSTHNLGFGWEPFDLEYHHHSSALSNATFWICPVLNPPYYYPVNCSSRHNSTCRMIFFPVDNAMINIRLPVFPLGLQSCPSVLFHQVCLFVKFFIYLMLYKFISMWFHFMSIDSWSSKIICACLPVGYVWLGANCCLYINFYYTSKM